MSHLAHTRLRNIEFNLTAIRASCLSDEQHQQSQCVIKTAKIGRLYVNSWPPGVGRGFILTKIRLCAKATRTETSKKKMEVARGVLKSLCKET